MIATAPEIVTRVHKYGAVIRVTPWLSTYYTDTQNVSIQTGRTDRFKANDQLGDPLQNQLGTLQEWGLKTDYALSKNIRLYGSAAHYKMALSNVRTFGDLGNGVEGIIQSAKDLSDGYEADAGASIGISRGRIDTIVTWTEGDSQIAADPTVQAAGFVKRKKSIMAKYTYTGGGLLNNAMIGAAYGDQSGKRNGNFYVPGYTVMDIFARYVYNKRLSAQLNLSNIGNKRIIIAQAASALVQTLDPMQTRLTVKYQW